MSVLVHNFSTEAMLWIKEVEMVESVDDLKSSRSSKRTHGPDFDRRENCFSTEQNHPEYPLQEKGQSGGNESSQRRPFRGRQIAYLMYKYFQVTGDQRFCREFYRPIYSCSSK